jgi:multisubunit Na+/H+ antiporter MnhC subunit
MIQRIQTVWLLMAAIGGFAMSQAPIFEARLPNNITQTVIASDNLFLFALVIGVALLSLACIFLFKKRPLQFKLTILTTLLTMIIVALEVNKVSGFQSTHTILKGSYSWGALLPIAMIVFLLLAARGIYKDEKLVKSLDRLR